jgi:D-beta-D-heptose 7-phosphate kinase/D-beta-D-heptose 1-phosphate adenosyltransferase
MVNKKIKNRTALIKELKSLRKKGKKIVFTNGCFDILHSGHIQYLKKAKSLGDVLVVGLNSDSSVRKIKGKRRPLIKQKDRALILASLEMVDFVVIFYEEMPLNLIRAIKPDILAKGADWKTEDIVGKDFVSSYGGQIRRIAFKKGYSTSKIISLIKKRFK